ncbi:MAG: ABC transporter permease [Spirochaetales bacterium]|nr:ABC transporter permease [Spirochaetales bacterium]
MADASLEHVLEKRFTFLDFWKRLVREKPVGTVGGVITVFLLFTAIFADLIAPYGMNETFVGSPLSGSSPEHWLGTDNLGRDILTRIIYGARISVIVGLSAATLGTIISAIIGIVSAYLGGTVDMVVQRFVDTWMCFPALIISMVLVIGLGASIWSIILALAFTWGVPGSRVVRGAVISIRENAYVDAARSIGCSTPRVLMRHILPNVTATLIILFSIRMPAMVLAEASLSFLGFGIPPPDPSWGSMLSGPGRQYMLRSPMMAVWPGLALAVVVYGVNMFGDAVRDLLDPRLRGGVARYDSKVKRPRSR